MQSRQAAVGAQARAGIVLRRTIGLMRDIFHEIFANQPLDPIEAARARLRPQLRKRFYKRAGGRREATAASRSCSTASRCERRRAARWPRRRARSPKRSRRNGTRRAT